MALYDRKTYHEEGKHPVTPGGASKEYSTRRSRNKDPLGLSSDVREEAESCRCIILCNRLGRCERRFCSDCSRCRNSGYISSCGDERGSRGDCEREWKVAGQIVVRCEYKVESVHGSMFSSDLGVVVERDLGGQAE
jgi:hypothetical protein